MTNREIAAQRFQARNRELIDLDFRGVGNETEINARYGYRHGWITVNGESFDHGKAFPGETFPRFPSDQGLSD